VPYRLSLEEKRANLKKMSGTGQILKQTPRQNPDRQSFIIFSALELSCWRLKAKKYIKTC
jgi:hypothetical protein